MTAPGRVNPPAPTAFVGQGFSLGAGGGSVNSTASNMNKEAMRKARLAAVNARANGKVD